MFANLSKNIDISPFTIKHKDWILSFRMVSILLSFCVDICSSWSMWVNYGCDVIKEVKVWCWWRQTIITCPFRHRISVENIMLLVTKHKYMSFIIHVSRFIWSSSWPMHLALSDLAMVKKYYICLSAHNASICLWLYWKLLRSNFFIWIMSES